MAVSGLQIIVVILVIALLALGIYIVIGGPGTKTIVTETITYTETVPRTIIQQETKTITTIIPTTIEGIVRETTTETQYTTVTSIATVTMTSILTSTVYQTVSQTIYTTTTITSPMSIILEYPKDLSTVKTLDINGDGISDVKVAINPWNMRSAQGYQKMIINLSTRSIKFISNLTNVSPAEWTNGYPEIYIGRKPWDYSYVNGFGVAFPMKISELKPFVVSFYICIDRLDPSMNFNIAADAWIVRESIARNAGASPSQGDIEIMVWLFNQNLQPAGSRIGEEILPIVINGTKYYKTFEVWKMNSVPWGGWDYIAFKPKDWSIRCGSVVYDPTQFVKALSKYTDGIDISNYYLLDWEIGTEWGSRTSNGIAIFEWTIRDFMAIPGIEIK
ncbi:glycoside hydrolase family 12 [Ignisphaera aggregans DSM 17230]|uniref:Glycoside hydrolase family 12 n=1 Tax=Ignisphaera aggregans (strain DSM 17230 / JCM 13409 / AQ1.S1) TaxID=583356 RepID=E0SRL7_IGNAA|nr:glycoside hydrolase family 12 [Ignisphaera aggregans DSM 17230]